MDANLPEILVTKGPKTGERHTVTEAGLRLGRSSSCEIAVADPAISRNHCLFEVRDGALWVTDLASANGTEVNGDLLGAESRALAAGDRVTAGETELTVVAPASGAADATDAAADDRAPLPPTTVDLGLGAAAPDAAADGARGGAPDVKRLALWIGAALAVAGAAAVILSDNGGAREQPPVKAVADAKPDLRSFTFEKVEADGEGIYRYALRLDEDGVLAVEIDDVPKENRRVRKDLKLSPEARTALAAIFASDALYRLEPDYTGVPVRQGTLKRFDLKVIRGRRVFRTTLENAVEPEAFREVRERLETFSKNELGIWAIQFSAEKLTEMSAEARRAGDAKWDERDVQHGNLAAALAKYGEAVFYLETVEPKPADYGDLIERRLAAQAELDRRYRDQRFLADRAINLGDWAAAQRELRILCELVPDPKDERHAEAAAKLIDVESRLKKR